MCLVRVVGRRIEDVYCLPDQHAPRRIRASEDNAMENHFTAVFEQDGSWWIGYVEELPGANTQGATLDQARENLKEAVALVLEANRDSG